MSSLPRYPADAFHYCPRCGCGELEIAPQGRYCRCGTCSFQFFFNCAAATAAFVFHRDQLILTVRAADPAKGALDLPGGFLDFGETAEQGLQREIFEELGIGTTDYRYLTSAPNDYLYGGVMYKTADIYFVCRAPDISNMQARDDVADFRLVAPGDVDPERLAFESSRSALRFLLESPRLGGVFSAAGD